MFSKTCAAMGSKIDLSSLLLLSSVRRVRLAGGDDIIVGEKLLLVC